MRKIASPKTEYRIFSNDGVTNSPTWDATVSMLPFGMEESGPARLRTALRNAAIALSAASDRDILVLTDSHNLSSSVCGLLRNFKSHGPTIIRTDPLIVSPPNGLLRGTKARYLRAALRSVTRLVVWSPAVIDRYSESLSIPRDKMIAQRFHHTLGGFGRIRPAVGEYIFSGGDSLRDYATLFDAVRGLKVPVVVATRLKLSPSIQVPDNVTVKAVSPFDFLRLMAESRMVVFPLRLDMLRTTGQQSYLNAMALGKAVIVTDTIDAPFYIEHRKTGLLVPSGDAARLREAITELLDRPDLARLMGEAARAFALPMGQEYTWGNILKLAVEIHEARIDGRAIDLTASQEFAG
jgi:hypothetical protein